MSTDADKIAAALQIANDFGHAEGDHHKMWVIDQMVRALTGGATTTGGTGRPVNVGSRGASRTGLGGRRCALARVPSSNPLR